jgi:asparagine synthase (glutamine-hydrolysing)
MLAMIRHRGPDSFGIYRDEYVGLGSSRLKIVDLEGGDQPICNEDGTLWIVFNGEIFNYPELRLRLEKLGHRFSTHCDTEVILHLYEEYGPDCLTRMNGQFAIALWDAKKRKLFLARDRLGVRPLYYTIQNGQLIFGSEIKAILAYPGVHTQIDSTALDQIFTYWSPLAPRTIFQSIFEVLPAHSMTIEDGVLTEVRYWGLDFTKSGLPVKQEQEYLEELEVLLIDSTLLRLRADVPVGAYLSGGLDSSLITALIQQYSNNSLNTFSIAFSDPKFDESAHQERLADFLGVEHHQVYAKYQDIGRVFPEVVWHTETPILRTAPAPMFLLSELVRDTGYKVVLTGEGADEFLAGYDIFKEAKIRQFWSREPASQIRPRLFSKIYPDISHLPHNSSYLTGFFGMGFQDTDDPEYSHAIRWRTTSRCKRFFSEDLRQAIELFHPINDRPVPVPPGFSQWHSLERAQYLEAAIFLPGYLLSSQGDRAAMAHSVEGRFPFLDHRVVEFCNKLPPNLKMFGLVEKYLLKKIARKYLPELTWTRTKRPYRAPIHHSFFYAASPDYVEELLSPAYLRRYGLFDPGSVEQLVRKAKAQNVLSETDDMALAGILSTQIVYQKFIENLPMPSPIADNEPLRYIDASGVAHGIQP